MLRFGLLSLFIFPGLCASFCFWVRGLTLFPSTSMESFLWHSPPSTEDMQRLPGSIPEDQALEVLLSYLLLFRNGVPIDMTNATKHRLIKEPLQRIGTSGGWGGLQARSKEVWNCSETF